MIAQSAALKAYLDGLQIVGEAAGPESIHPRYLELRELRHASMTLMEGVPALRRDARGQPATGASAGLSAWGDTRSLPAVSGQRFLFPETVNETQVRAGEAMSPWARRVARLRISPVYRTAVEAIAATPFSGRPTIAGWSPALADLLDGKGAGVDGRGSSVMAFYREVFRLKHFAGIHWARLEAFRGDGRTVPALVHLAADELLFWHWERVAGVPTLRSANVHLREGERLTYNTANDGAAVKVVWAKWSKASGAEYWKILDRDEVPIGVVPLVPFYSAWGTPFESQPPYADAAELQMEVARAQSEADDLRRRIAKGTTFVVTGWKDGIQRNRDGTESVKPLPVQAVGLVFTGEANVQNVQIDAAPLEALRETIAQDEDLIRESCGSTSRRVLPGEAVTATEIGLRSTESRSFMSASVLSDAASLTVCAEMMEKALGSIATGAGQITIPLSFDADEKRAVLAALDPWHARGVVPGEVVAELIAQAYPEIGAEAVEKLRAQAKRQDDNDNDRPDEGTEDDTEPTEA